MESINAVSIRLPNARSLQDPRVKIVAIAASAFTLYTTGNRDQIETYLGTTEINEMLEELSHDSDSRQTTAFLVHTAAKLCSLHEGLFEQTLEALTSTGFEECLLSVRLMNLYAEKVGEVFPPTQQELYEALNLLEVPHFAAESGVIRELAFLFSVRLLGEYGDAAVAWDIVKEYDENLLPPIAIRDRQALNKLTQIGAEHLIKSAIDQGVMDLLQQAVESYTTSVCRMLPGTGLLWSLISYTFVRMARGMAGLDMDDPNSAGGGEKPTLH